MNLLKDKTKIKYAVIAFLALLSSFMLGRVTKYCAKCNDKKVITFTSGKSIELEVDNDEVMKIANQMIEDLDTLLQQNEEEIDVKDSILISKKEEIQNLTERLDQAINEKDLAKQELYRTQLQLKIYETKAEKQKQDLEIKIKELNEQLATTPTIYPNVNKEVVANLRSQIREQEQTIQILQRRIAELEGRVPPISINDIKVSLLKNNGSQATYARNIDYLRLQFKLSRSRQPNESLTIKLFKPSGSESFISTDGMESQSQYTTSYTVKIRLRSEKFDNGTYTIKIYVNGEFNESISFDLERLFKK